MTKRTFTFEDSDTEIKGHKLILETVSPVFEKMFNGSFAEKETALIRGISPNLFQKMIGVIYMQEVKVSSLYEAVELCNVAEMYEIDDLKVISSDFMYENVRNENCFYLYEKAVLFNLTRVANRCRGFFNVSIGIYPPGLLLQEYDVDEDSFVEFLTINESPDSALYQVLEFFVRYGILNSYEKALGKIRFLTMSVDEIVSISLLTETEKLAIISNIEAVKKGSNPKLPMPEHLTSSTEMRQEHLTFHYRYFWINMLYHTSVEHFSDMLKRISAIGIFTTGEVESVKEIYDRYLKGKETPDKPKWLRWVHLFKSPSNGDDLQMIRDFLNDSEVEKLERNIISEINP